MRQTFECVQQHGGGQEQAWQRADFGISQGITVITQKMGKSCLLTFSTQSDLYQHFSFFRQSHFFFQKSPDQIKKYESGKKLGNRT